jgi:hypothetical protein
MVAGGTAQPGVRGAAPVRSSHADRALDRLDLVVEAMGPGPDKEAFAKGEHGNGEGCDLGPVQTLRDAEGHAGLASEALKGGFPEGRRDGHEGQQQQGNIFSRAEGEGQFDDVGSKEGEGEGRQKACDKGADGGSFARCVFNRIEVVEPSYMPP